MNASENVPEFKKNMTVSASLRVWVGSRGPFVEVDGPDQGQNRGHKITFISLQIQQGSVKLK